MNFHVTHSAPSCIDYHKSSSSGANPMTSGNRFSFVKTLRMIQEIERAAKGVPWLTLNHMQILLHIFDMETPEGLEAQTLAKVTGHNKSTVNRIVHSLGDGGGRGAASKGGLKIIQMVTDPNDRRIRRIKLTPRGESLKKLLLAAGGETDEQANMMAMDMAAQIYESASNVNYAMTPQSITFGVDGAEVDMSVSAKGEVGNVTVETTGGFNSSQAESYEPQSMASLERALKYAAKNDIWHVKYRGQEVPLIGREKANAEVQAGRLYKTNSLGIWVYHDSPVAGDYGSIPKFIQADDNEDSINKYIKNIRNKIVHGGERIDVTLDEVAKTLNNHQRKQAVTKIVDNINEQRKSALKNAEHNLTKSETMSQEMSRLLEKGDEVMKLIAATDDPMRQKELRILADSLHRMMKEISEMAASDLQAAQKERETAKKLTDIQTLIQMIEKQFDDKEERS
jgi:DNA-binding MarR family transcriptional regulator